VLGGAGRVATSFARTRFLDGDARAQLVGNPVREPVRALRDLPYRPPGEGRVVDLLVFGGSQGAASFGEVVPQAVLSLPQGLRSRLRIVQQCRPESIDRVRTSYVRAGVVAEIAPFFADLPQRMAAAHLVIGRSGASTVAELAAIGRPSILVPYPYAADDHQTANARAFEATGACIVLPHATFTAATLAGHLVSLTEEPERLAAMAGAAHAAGRPDAAARLADVVTEFVSLPLSPAATGVAA
jgi:UDP-N-acetylglucosamine--N-acetylmuramyl-(pentapeptide) pyrophosphoryl-undecaprenol N-acetylglucosamine transferase